VRYCLLLSLLAYCSAPAWGQSERFSIRIGRGGLSGTEEYTISSGPAGHRLTGKIHLQRAPGMAQDLVHEEVLGPGWTLQSYKLEASAAGQTQTLEAKAEGAAVLIRATAGGQSREKTVPFETSTVLLDNLVGSHYQVLLNRIQGNAAPPQQWLVLVPQPMTTVPGKLSVAAVENARLTGAPLQVRKYALELANVLVEFWADTAGNRLMRVYVPMQDVEIVREGFGLNAAPAPAPASDAKTDEREVAFPSAGFQFPATLRMPASRSGRVPAVLLVHGSGPHDRDETIGPNKPFRDIAAGLGAAGIATLRYDKRTFAFKEKIGRTITLDGEVIDDAVAALEYLRTQPGVDPGRVYVLGHSLGGTAAPMIAARAPWLHGAILMAAAVRPLDEIIFEQTARGMEIAHAPAADIKAKVDELKAQFRRVRSGEAPDDETVFFAPAGYWRDLFNRDPLKALSQLKLPVLVLQGGKDIQVGKADYDLIVAALRARESGGAEFKWFPDLNHLMMRVEGEPTGAEYGRAGFLDSHVISAIVSWMKDR
jgi:uncharacterized protein